MVYATIQPEGEAVADLGIMDGHPVLRSGIEIRNIAGGLRESAKIDPQILESGDRVYVLVEAIVSDLNFKQIVKGDPEAGWTRVHVTNAEAVTIVDRDLVAGTLETHKARLALAKDEESGQQRIQHEQELDLEHTAGKHKRLKKGCPKCQLELDLEEKEIAAAKAKKATKTVKAAAKTTELPADVADVADISTAKGRRPRTPKAK